MRRLVIGCGYLGERVARRWGDAGDTVYATTRGRRYDALVRAGLQPLVLDVTRDALQELPEVDTVVFAVGRAPGDAASPFHIHREGLAAALNALSHVPDRFIYVSSTSVYAQDAGEWVDEESVCAARRDGGRALLVGEKLLLDHHVGRKATVLRLAGLYGPGRLPRQRDLAGGRRIPGSPHAYINLVHVDDAARAVVMAAASDRGCARTYIVSDGSPLTRGEYADLLTKRMGLARPTFEGGIGRGKRVRNDRLDRELGVQPQRRSFHEGLEDT